MDKTYQDSTQQFPVLALTGPFGAGLTTAAQRMQTNSGYQHISLSDALRREWLSRYNDPSPARSDLQRLGDELRQADGPGALTRELLGWRPVKPGLVEDIDKGHYFS